MTTLMKQKQCLNLGCGTDYYSGWLNVDLGETDIYNNKIKVDKVVDLDKFPWPFKDNSFKQIEAKAIIEHLKEDMKVWYELKRIAQDGCIIRVTVPHFSGVVLYDDPTHKHGYTIKTCETIAQIMGFKVLKKRILMFSSNKLRFMDFFPNIASRVYEKLFAGILPSHCLYFEYEVRK